MSEQRAWDVLEALSSDLDRLLGADLSGLDDVVSATQALEEVARRVAVAQQRMVGEVVARDVAGERGSTPVKFQQAVLRVSPGEAEARVRLAEDLSPRRALTGEALPPRLPSAAAAQAEGAISVGHVRVIQHTMKALPAATDPGLWTEAETKLAEFATQFTPNTSVTSPRTYVPAWIRTALSRKNVNCSSGGSCPSPAMSTAPTGCAVGSTRKAPGRSRSPWTRWLLRHRRGTEPRNPVPARRTADALVELAQRAISGATLPDSGGRPTQIVLRADLADLRAKTGLATLAHTGSPVTTETAKGLACEAEVIGALFGEGGQVLPVGRTRRLATKHQRDALIARAGGCTAPGCDAPPAWTQAHHVVHWADGEAINVDNLTLLCGRHHRSIHSGQLTIRTINGVPRVRPPPSAESA